MIFGRVIGKNVVVPLALRGFNNQEVALDVVVDTGFNGPLSLPFSVIQTLGLFKSGQVEATLANGMMFLEDLYSVVVVWDGIEQIVSASASDPEPLLGLALMQGYNLSVDVEDGGQVRLSRLGGELTPALLESET